MQVRALPVSLNGPLAQLAEHLTLTQRVLGSNPRGSSTKSGLVIVHGTQTEGLL